MRKSKNYALVFFRSKLSQIRNRSRQLLMASLDGTLLKRLTLFQVMHEGAHLGPPVE